jgi:hypothetical protein
LTRPTAVVCLWTLLVASCATQPRDELRIDGSTPESFHRTRAALFSSVGPDGQARLNLAVLAIGAGHFKSAADIPPGYRISIDTIRDDVAGKTFVEIVALAKKSPVKVSAPQHDGAATKLSVGADRER